MGFHRWNTLVMDFTGFHVWRWAIQWNFIMNNGDFMRFNDWTWGFSEPTTLGRPVFCTPTDAVWFFTSHGSQALSLSRFHQSLSQALIAKQQQEEGASPQLLATAKSSTGMAPLASWCSCQKIWLKACLFVSFPQKKLLSTTSTSMIQKNLFQWTHILTTNKPTYLFSEPRSTNKLILHQT